MSGASRAVIYARISLDRSGAGLGVERQIEDCQRLAEGRGLEVAATLSDNDISAYSGKRRPGYQQVLELMRSGEVGYVIAWHVDRLHRSLKDLETYIDLAESGNISTLTVRAGELDLSSASGRLVARMLGSVARHESEQKSERVRRARRQAAEKGQAHGPLGYGYDADQHVILAEAHIIKEISRRVLGGETLYSIAVDLNSRAVPPPGAGRWHHGHIKQVLDDRETGLNTVAIELVKALANGKQIGSEEIKRIVPGEAAEALMDAARSEEPVPHGALAKLLTDAGLTPPGVWWRAANVRTMIRRGSLCGWRDFEPGGRGGKGEMVAEGSWTPILTKETSEKLRRVLDAPGRKMKGRHPKYLLVGTLVCGECGSRLNGVTTKGARRYGCGSQPGLANCGRLTVTAPPVDALVTEAVLELLSDTDFRTNRKRWNASDEKQVRDAELEMAEIDTDSVVLAGEFGEGSISRSEWQTAREGMAKRRGRLEKVVGKHSPEMVSALSGVPVNRQEAEEWWNAAAVERQRIVVKALIERVVVAKAKSSANRFDRSRISQPVWRA